MKLNGYRLLFGEYKGAHDLILSAPEIKDRALPLAVRTDRPGQPGRVRWTAFDGGFAYKDFYVFARTFPDPNASRAGMVLSEAFAFPLEQAIEIPGILNIQQAFCATLQEAKEKRETSISVELETDSARLENNLLPGLANIVRHLLAADDDAKPIIWLGQEGFSTAVAALWSRLPKDWRADFNFRLSFAPEDTTGQRWTIVCTPHDFASRWAGFRTVSPEEDVTAFSEDDLSAAFLLGKPEGKLIAELLTELGCQATNLKSLKLAEESAVYRRRAASEKLDFSERLAYVRRLGLLAPDSRDGEKLKTQAIGGLMMQLKTEGTADNVFALNNLDVSPFVSASDSLKASVADWLRRNFWKMTSANLLKILLKASLATETAWARGIADGLSKLRKEWRRRPSAIFLWKMWDEKEELFHLTEKILPATKQAIADLTETCPRRLTPTLGEKIRHLAQREKSPELHAVALAAYLDPKEAVPAQLDFEDLTASNKQSGLPLLFERMPFEDLLAETLRRSDDRLFELVAQLAQKSSTILKQIEIVDPAWQRIALFCLEEDARHFWRHLREPQVFVFSILDLLISEKLKERELINFAAESDYADFTLYPQREKIWQHLTGAALRLSLEKTVAGWWRQFIQKDANQNSNVPEEPLRREILRSNRIESALKQSPSPISTLLEIFETFSDLGDSDFAGKLRLSAELNSRVNQFDALAIGEFVSRRRWKKSADTVHELVARRGYRDLLPALEECRDLFGILDKFLSPVLSGLRGVKLDWDDWYTAFTQCLVELYPDGPQQDNLWKRAGGDASILVKSSTGRESWQHAIHDLIKGRAGKKISTESIIDEVKADFNNDKINRLEWYYYELKRDFY